MAGAGAAVVIAAIVAAGFASGVIGGGGEDDPAGATGSATTSGGTPGDGDNGGGAGDQSGGAAAEVEYELETPDGVYGVEVPVGWELDPRGPEEERPNGQRRTRWTDPDGLMRLGINRFPDTAGDLGAFARTELDTNVGAGRADFQVLVEPEQVTIGGREAYRFVFERQLEELGQGRGYAYLFMAGDDAYRVQGSASDEGGAEAQRVARQAARHATATLSAGGG